MGVVGKGPDHLFHVEVAEGDAFAAHLAVLGVENLIVLDVLEDIGQGLSGIGKVCFCLESTTLNHKTVVNRRCQFFADQTLRVVLHAVLESHSLQAD